MNKLILALPSKGRLKEKALYVFAKGGIDIALPQDARSYRGSAPSIPQLEVMFLSASEIAREVASGGVHLGVTGEDLAREYIAQVDSKIEFVTKLGFGGADVVVATPEAWLDVRNMADLGAVAAKFRALYGRQMKVATKYFQLTTDFFTRQHGIDQYRIVESLGATEGAPAAGSADIIVDITSTGSTLRANQLRILDDGVILKSEANLMASKTAPLSASQKTLCEELKSMIAQSMA